MLMSSSWLDKCPANANEFKNMTRYANVGQVYSAMFDILPNKDPVSSSLIVTFVLGFFWIFFLTATNFVDKKGREKELLARLGKYQELLYKLKVEKESVTQRQSSGVEKISSLEEGNKELSHRLVTLQTAYQKEKADNRSLRSKIDSLEEEVTVNCKLQEELEEQQAEIERLKTQVDELLSENEQLKEDNSEQTDEIFSLKQENDSLNSAKKDLLSKQQEVSLELQDLQEKLEAVIQERRDLQTVLDESKREALKLREELETKDNLNTVLTDMIKDMELKKTKRLSLKNNSDQSDLPDNNQSQDHADHVDGQEESSSEHEETASFAQNKIHEVLELAQLKADFETLTKHKNDLLSQLESALEDNQKLTNEINDYRRVKETSEEERQAAIFAKEEAERKLEFLEKYFMKKEVELQVKLGELEVMKTQKESSASSLEKHLTDLKEQNELYRSQLESMKKELSLTESTLKNQIASLEKKAHDSWVFARNAEREAAAYKNDASFLRQQLTLMANNTSSSSVDGEERGSFRDGNASSNSSIIDFSMVPPPPPPLPPALFGMTPTSMASVLNTSFPPISVADMNTSFHAPTSVGVSMTPTGDGNVSRSSSVLDFSMVPPQPPPPPPALFPAPNNMFPMAPPGVNTSYNSTSYNNTSSYNNSASYNNPYYYNN